MADEKSLEQLNSSKESLLDEIFEKIITIPEFKDLVNDKEILIEKVFNSEVPWAVSNKVWIVFNRIALEYKTSGDLMNLFTNYFITERDIRELESSENENN